MASDSTTLNGLFKALYADKIENLIPAGVSLLNLMDFGRETWTVAEWLNHDFPETMIEKYPNAKEAHRIKNTKLYKSLK